MVINNLLLLSPYNLNNVKLFEINELIKIKNVTLKYSLIRSHKSIITVSFMSRLCEKIKSYN